MSGKEAVFTKEAPTGKPGATPIGSQAVKSNGFVFVSGQVARDAKNNNEVVGGDIKDHTRKCIENMQAILKEAGSDLSKVVKVNIFLSDISLVGKVNEVYLEYFKDEDIKPARSCIGSQLPPQIDVEMECTALA